MTGGADAVSSAKLVLVNAQIANTRIVIVFFILLPFLTV
jgi:hypothetical protein